MLKEFEKVLDMNVFYSKGLSKWASNTENLNDDALLLMLQNLIKEYEMQSDILFNKLKFEKELYFKKRKFEKKEASLELLQQIRKTKYELKKRKRMNKKLLSLFKKKLNLDFKTDFNKSKQDFNEYVKNIKQTLKIAPKEAEAKVELNETIGDECATE